MKLTFLASLAAFGLDFGTFMVWYTGCREKVHFTKALLLDVIPNPEPDQYQN
jgi:hypothetical protein